MWDADSLMEIKTGSTRSVYGKDEYPLCDTGRYREPVQFSSIDVSFISLTKVLLPIRNYLTDEGQIVALIKPQFEAGREKVGKKGVVREKSTHIEVIHKVIDYAMSIGFEVLNLEFSPIKGPEGNIEYLVHLQKCEATDRISPQIDVEKTVDLSFATLAKG